MPVVTILLSMISLCLAVISFFLIRHFKKVDSIAGDVKQLLLKDASAGEVQKQLVKDVEELEKSNFDLSMANAKYEGRLATLEARVI